MKYASNIADIKIMANAMRNAWENNAGFSVRSLKEAHDLRSEMENEMRSVM